jgi:hypoxanthine phosphoribosyltransferase
VSAEAATARVLFDAATIARRVAGLAEELRAALGASGASGEAASRPLLVGVLRGAWVFLADLVRVLPPDLADVDFVRARSYGADRESSGKVHITRDVEEDVRGRDVVLVEDIVDSGRTLAALQAHLRGKGARSVRVVTLLDKPSRRVVDVRPDWVGFVIPDVFVIGYGLDWAGKGRNLPDLRALEP